MNSLEHFNQYYERELNQVKDESLKDFFQTIVFPRLKSNDITVLDLGSGSYSIFEELNLLKKNIEALDFSDVAISKAQLHSSEIHYFVADLSAENILEKNKCDLIFDSHCLHCIEGIIERKTAFENILSALKVEGIFCAEMMVQSKKSSINLPFKYIPPALELEQELIEAGFKISYFMIEKNLVFHNENGECDLLRVVCRK